MIGPYRAHSLMGESKLIDNVDYISFSGDYGFSSELPAMEAIERHISQEAGLLGNFQLKVINLEFLLPPESSPNRRITSVALDIMKRSGYDLVSRANNHAMDFGPEGVDYNTSRLEKAGFNMIGPRRFPVYYWNSRGRHVAIFAVTDYTDRPDLQGVILKINDADLNLIKEESSKSNFRIAFVHLGSMSWYPSPHERRQVERILDAGADLIICTGSHFTKGFVYEKGKPVVYDIGNHLLSFVDSVTEPIGMHFVAGFRDGNLVQLFVVPFYNEIMKGKTGPLDRADFALFENNLVARSTSDPNRYFSDPSSLARLKERINRFRLADIKEMRPRYVIYAVGIVYNHYPLLAIGSGLLVVSLTLILARLVFARQRTRKGEA